MSLLGPNLFTPTQEGQGLGGKALGEKVIPRIDEPRHIYRVGQSSGGRGCPYVKEQGLGATGKCYVLGTKPDTRRLKSYHIC